MSIDALFAEQLPKDLLESCKNNWLYTLHAELPFRAVFDAGYLLKMDAVLDVDVDERYLVFTALIKEIEVDGQESGRYGDADTGTGQGVMTEQVDI